MTLSIIEFVLACAWLCLVAYLIGRHRGRLLERKLHMKRVASGGFGIEGSVRNGKTSVSSVAVTRLPKNQHAIWTTVEERPRQGLEK